MTLRSLTGYFNSMNFIPVVENAVVGAPDWFLPNGVTASHLYTSDEAKYFLIAFSSKPFVHIYRIDVRDLKDKESYEYSYVGQLQAHHEKTTALSFCSCDLSNFVESSICATVLMTCGNDGLVRQWNYIDQEWLLTEELNVREHNESFLPTSVCLRSFSNQLTTVIGTNKGTLILWCSYGGGRESTVASKKFENEPALTASWEIGLSSEYTARFAIGYKKGIVGVYSIQKSSVTSASFITQISRFRAHEKDICHVVWRPNSEYIPDSVNSDSDLLTVGRDQMIKLWKTTTAWCSAAAKIPGSAKSSTKDRSVAVGLPWISATWLPKANSTKNDMIILSGLRGELYTWCGSKQPVRLDSGDVNHFMLIFSIKNAPQLPYVFITAGQDRQLFIWTFDEVIHQVRIVSNIPTISSGVSVLTQSKHGHGPVTVGMADGSILLWHHTSHSITDVHKTKKHVTTLWPRGVNTSGITALAWHPSDRNENLLAYGTEAGCVELIDTSKASKPTHKVKTQPYSFGSTVYRVAWGPVLFDDKTSNEPTEIVVQNDGESDTVDESEDKNSTIQTQTSDSCRFAFYVYSVCKGKIYCHIGFQRPPVDVTLKFPTPTGIDIEQWKGDKRSDISFLFPDQYNVGDVDGKVPLDYFSCIIAVGFRSGCVDIYGKIERATDKTLIQPICRIASHTKCVNCLTWSSYHPWLAIGSNETFITVTDLGDVLRSANKTDKEYFPVLSNVMVRLEGHCNRITCLDWSPHNPNLLLSASFDGTANVWEIVHDNSASSSSIANFRAHRLRLFACLWSRQEADLAYSGGELCHLFSWHPSKLIHHEPPNTRRYRPPPVKRVQQSVSHQLDVESVVNTASLEPEQDSESVQQSTFELKAVVADDKPIKCTSLKKQSKGDKRKRPSLIPHFLNRTQQGKCGTNLEFSPPIELDAKFLQLSEVIEWLKNNVPLSAQNGDLLFLLTESASTRLNLVRFLDEESEYHFTAYKSSQHTNGLVHLDAYCMLQLWLGRVHVVARRLCAEGHLPFWLLWAFQLCQTSMSPLNKDLLHAKVKEMTSSANPDALVVTTLLVCAGQSKDAIDYLVSCDRFKEAILLARLRLSPPEASPVLSQCVDRILARRLTNDVPFIHVIYALGQQDYADARLLLRRSAISAAERAGLEVEQLLYVWSELNILSSFPLSTDDYSINLSTSFIRLATHVLLIGFNQPYSDSGIYFEQWSRAFDSGNRSSASFRSLLQVGSMFASILRGSVTAMGDVINLAAEDLPLIQSVASDRQPSSDWSICVAHLAVDYLLCHSYSIQHQTPDDESLTRLSTSFKRCKQCDPSQTIQLAAGLLLSLNQQDSLTHEVIVEKLSEIIRLPETT